MRQQLRASGRHIIAASIAGSVAMSGVAQGQITILHSFGENIHDGYSPTGDLRVSGSTLFGTTRLGGGWGERGTVFRIDADGTNYALVHSFLPDGSEGMGPSGNVAVDGSTIYGSTPSGGEQNRGTLFRVNVDGSDFTVLHHFVPGGNGAQSGYNGVIASGSTILGMRQAGQGFYGQGMLYSFDLGGDGLSILHSFRPVFDGYGPQGDVLLVGSQLYGMSTYGGAALFRSNNDGTDFTVLHRFGNAGDGALPFGSLTVDRGTLYGMTEIGGPFSDGTIFSIGLDGSDYRVLRGFGNDEFPVGDLIVDGSTIYGMARQGGDYGRGYIFKIATGGSGFEKLHSFMGSPTDGQYPYGSLTQIGSTLYGTTAGGGLHGFGTVFSFTIPGPGTFAILGLFTLAAGTARRRS